MQNNSESVTGAVKVAPAGVDRPLLATVALLLTIGLMMVASASMPLAERTTGQPFYYLFRQTGFATLGLAIGYVMFCMSVEFWYRASPWLLIGAILLLMAVLIPGIGREVNGSLRWIPVGVMNIQPSELAKLFTFIYIAGYLQRHYDSLKTSTMAMLRPLFVLGFIGVLIIFEPDFGSTVVLFTVSLGMIFLAGVNLWRFSSLFLVTLFLMSMVLYAAPYRRARLAAFLNPWEDAYGSGFQLVQSLIAVGRGEVSGVGLGGSVQKLFYLPEAHTDFIFAIWAEETGLVGVGLLIILYLTLVARAFLIGARAEQLEMRFAGILAYGIGIWITLQALVNMAVVTGLLPTKGLTLPFISYGGSSIITSIMAVSLLFRIDLEVSEAQRHKIIASFQIEADHLSHSSPRLPAGQPMVEVENP